MIIDCEKPNVLHLVHRVPYPPDKGDRIRTYQLLRFIAQRAHVHLACIADESLSEKSLAVLRALCSRVSVAPVGKPARWVRALTSLSRGRTATEGAFASPALHATVANWARTTRFDAVLASASSMASYLETPELHGVPAVIDFMDVDSEKWLDYAATSSGPRAWLYRTEGRRLRQLEAGLAARVRAITVVSQAEADLYRQFCTAAKVRVIPNGVDLDYFQPAVGIEESGCVFVGALDYRPNVDGVCWFCRDVWPEIRRHRPQATLALVGRRPAPAVRRLAELPGVTVVGQVPDVRPYLTSAAVVVVPLRIARGIQNKVLEALAMGKATVVSPPALAALGTEPGVHLLQAADRGEWIEALTGLLADAGRRQELGEAGRRYVAEHHQWARCLAPMAELLGLAPAATTAGAESQPGC